MYVWSQLAVLSAIVALSTSAILDMTDVSGTVCTGRRVGDVVPHPLDCQAYFICGPVPTIRYCDQGLHYDTARNVCNWPQHAKCDLLSMGNNEADQPQESSNPEVVSSGIILHSHPIFIAIDVDTGRAVDPMEKYDPKNIECRHLGAYFIPHPHSCRRYFICAYGHLHKHQCGHGTSWNYKRQECELDAESVCYSRSITGTDIDAGNEHIPDENNEALDALVSSYESTSTTTMPSTVCFVIDTTIVTGGSTGTTGSTWNPTGTYHTATGTTGSTWNPTGTYHTATGTTGSTWNPTGTYHTATATTSKPPTTAGRVDGLPSNRQCPRNGEAYLPNVDDCSKYFICIAGRPVATSCPQGLYWDQNAEFCDLAKNVKCYQKQ